MAVFSYIGLVLYLSPTVFSAYDEFAKTPQPYAFQIPMNIFLSGYRGFATETDISITLNVTYPKGTLIIDEPVSIFAKAIFHDTAFYKVTHVTVGFQNSLRYPLTYNQWGEPSQGALNFHNPEATTNPNIGHEGNILTATSNLTVSWTIDGDYKPIIQLFFADNTSRVYVYDEVVIHVYPEEQLVQIEVNRVNTLLSIGLFVFGAFGVGTIAKDMWTEVPKQNKPLGITIEQSKATQQQYSESEEPLQSQQPQPPRKKPKKPRWRRR
jgi:hypothetical protein